MKKIIIPILTAFSFVVFSFPVSAQTINSVSGSVVHSQNITISGNGFGTKNQAPPLFWNDMESLTVNSPSTLSSEAGFTRVETTPSCNVIPSAPGENATIHAMSSSSFRWPGAPSIRSTKVLGGGYPDIMGLGYGNCDRQIVEIKAPSTPTKLYWSYYKRYSPDFLSCTANKAGGDPNPNVVSNTNYTINLATDINSTVNSIQLTGDYERLSYDSGATPGGDTLLIDSEKVKIIPPGRTGNTITVARGVVGVLYSAIDNLTTTVTIGPQNGVGAFHSGDIITIDNEEMYVSSVNGSSYNLTVIRGYNGTAPASHTVSSIIINPVTRAPHIIGTRAYLRLKPLYNLKAAFGDWYVSDSDAQYLAMYEPVDPIIRNSITGLWRYFWAGEGGSLFSCYRCQYNNTATNGIIDHYSPATLSISEEWKKMETIVNEGPQGWIRSSLNNDLAQQCNCESWSRFTRWTLPYTPTRTVPNSRTNAAVSPSDTAITVVDSSAYQIGDIIMIQGYPEEMRVNSVSDSTHIIVTRGYNGTTPGAYATGRTVYEETTQGQRALRLGIYIDRIANNEFGTRPKHYCDNSWVYMDDIYVDTTFSRIMLANNSNYDSATIIEPQIPSAWSDGSITTKVNLGKLPDSGTAYLFVFDANNNHNTVGYSVTLVSSGGDTTPPVAPTGVVIQ